MKKINRSGFINILGPTNAGKSTLINSLVGSKISIVTPKVQTTRFITKGIVNFNKSKSENTQLIFIDNPGFFEPKRNFDEFVLKQSLNNLNNADYTIVILDVRNSKSKTLILNLSKTLPIDFSKISIVLNKIDLVDKEILLDVAKNINENVKYEKIFMVSALRGHGCKTLLEFLSTKMPHGHFLYDGDTITDLNNNIFSSEITREKLFNLFNKEIPYNLFVKTEHWEDKEKVIIIHQTIYVSKINHKKIIIGKNGQNLKRVGIQARIDLETNFNKKVHLFLHVKVKKDWIKKPHLFNASGVFSA